MQAWPSLSGKCQLPARGPVPAGAALRICMELGSLFRFPLGSQSENTCPEGCAWHLHQVCLKTAESNWALEDMRTTPHA